MTETQKQDISLGDLETKLNKKLDAMHRTTRATMGYGIWLTAIALAGSFYFGNAIGKLNSKIDAYASQQAVYETEITCKYNCENQNEESPSDTRQEINAEEKYSAYGQKVPMTLDEFMDFVPHHLLKCYEPNPMEVIYQQVQDENSVCNPDSISFVLVE